MFGVLSTRNWDAISLAIVKREAEVKEQLRLLLEAENKEKEERNERNDRIKEIMEKNTV